VCVCVFFSFEVLMFANIAKDDDEQQEQEEKYENEN
jgi:hypothetical protein